MIVRHNVQSGVDEVVSTNAALPGDFYQNVQSLDMTPDGRFITFVGNMGRAFSLLQGDHDPGPFAQVAMKRAVGAEVQVPVSFKMSRRHHTFAKDVLILVAWPRNATGRPMGSDE